VGQIKRRIKGRAMHKWQIDKSIINDNKKLLAQKYKAYFLFFEAFLAVHCK